VPFSAIGALLARIRSAPAPDSSSGAALAASLGDIDIDLRAEVGATDLTADEVLALKPGDVIALTNHAKGAVQLYADSVPLATAMGGVLGQKVDVDAPAITAARTRAEIKTTFQGAVGATVADIRLFGEDCRLVQLIPTIFTMRATQALAVNRALDYDEDSAEFIRAALRGVPLRVWAELGRARLRSLDAAALADGAIVELDRAAEDPIDVYVNGSRIATGRLIEVEE